MNNANNREQRLPHGSGLAIGFVVSIVFWIVVIAAAFPLRGLL